MHYPSEFSGHTRSRIRHWNSHLPYIFTTTVILSLSISLIETLSTRQKTLIGCLVKSLSRAGSRLPGHGACADPLAGLPTFQQQFSSSQPLRVTAGPYPALLGWSDHEVASSFPHSTGLPLQAPCSPPSCPSPGSRRGLSICLFGSEGRAGWDEVRQLALCPVSRSSPTA